MKRLPSITALAMVAALSIAGCSSSTGNDDAATPAAEETTTSAPAEETTEPAAEETEAGNEVSADELAAKLQGVKVGDSELAVDEQGDELLSEVATNPSDVGFAYENEACGAAMFGPWKRVLDTDTERAVGMNEVGTAFVVLAFDSADQAAAFVTDSEKVTTDCATFAITEPADSSGTMTKADVEVEGADSAVVSDSVTTLAGQETPGSEVVAAKGNIVVVGYSTQALNTSAELAAAASEILAK